MRRERFTQMLAALIRKHFSQALIGGREIALENRRPTREELRRRLQGIEELGIYLHIPFCRQICPYCPYYKEIFYPEIAQSYAQALIRLPPIRSSGFRTRSWAVMARPTTTDLAMFSKEDKCSKCLREYSIRQGMNDLPSGRLPDRPSRGTVRSPCLFTWGSGPVEGPISEIYFTSTLSALLSTSNPSKKMERRSHCRLSFRKGCRWRDGFTGESTRPDSIERIS